MKSMPLLRIPSNFQITEVKKAENKGELPEFSFPAF
jgi:hypothetical protein